MIQVVRLKSTFNSFRSEMVLESARAATVLHHTFVVRVYIATVVEETVRGDGAGPSNAANRGASRANSFSPAPLLTPVISDIHPKLPRHSPHRYRPLLFW